MTHCIFCDIVAGRLPAVTLYEDDKVMAFMDIFPLRRGHVLVIPRQHHRQLHELDSELRAHLLDTATRVTQAIYRSALAPAAVHYNVNDGPAAHQTVPHVHLHILPRYRGDTGSFLLRLLRKPADLLLGPTAQATLEKDAQEIRRQLAVLA
ncbi:MAG: HIT family protein [Moraxellaceae bacterium]|jgi:histidine triad (HIT) family protein|nr:HIT family protein [Moraxellaceae bacterium]MBP7230207.1 HIT family protein [Moraxellaceae bacterium]MBP8852133.1 HIT family protein [Moraxellaceae bacterium]MBP9045658.1 HIT family protein [Moraxellaceae bacterium]MBP9731311.1 HIT family protein [Moraxellaceae bacterium]